jgi:hypothetical protein
VATVAGFDHYFIKPDSPEELVRIFDELAELPVTPAPELPPVETRPEDTKAE